MNWSGEKEDLTTNIVCWGKKKEREKVFLKNKAISLGSWQDLAIEAPSPLLSQQLTSLRLLLFASLSLAPWLKMPLPLCSLRPPPPPVSLKPLFSLLSGGGGSPLWLPGTCPFSRSPHFSKGWWERSSPMWLAIQESVLPDTAPRCSQTLTGNVLELCPASISNSLGHNLPHPPSFLLLSKSGQCSPVSRFGVLLSFSKLQLFV